MEIRHKEKAEICSSLSPSSPSLSRSLSPRPPPTSTTSIQLKYVTITEWQLDTQWPVRTFISQCFILARSQTAEKISKLFQGLEGDQTFLASPLTRPLIYKGLVRARLECGLKHPEPRHCPSPRQVPTPASLCSQNQQAQLRHRTLHPCTRARRHVKAKQPQWNPFGRGQDREKKGGVGAGERTQLSSPHQSLSLFLPSQKLSSSPRKKPYPATANTSELFQPYSNGNTQLKKKKNELDQKCRCLKYVHCITIFASNYNDGNGWKYIVSICMENNCRVRGQRALCLALECEFLSPVWRPSSLEQIMNTCVWTARAVNLGSVYP